MARRMIHRRLGRMSLLAAGGGAGAGLATVLRHDVHFGLFGGRHHVERGTWR